MARRSFPLLIAGTLVAGATVGLMGCADAVTFSKTERAEGRIALQEGDAEQATIVFANQVRRNPRDYRAHFHLGEARWASGRYPEALRSYKTALEVMDLGPRGRGDEEYRILIVEELARALAETDTTGAQLAQIEQASRGDKTLKLLVALTHAKAGRPDAAIAAFREARLLDREDPQIVKSYGLYLESIQQDEAAQDMLRRAYSLNPQDQEVAAALRRLGIVPGPAILSKNQLAKPAVPLGPLPEIRLTESEEKAEEKPKAQLN